MGLPKAFCPKTFFQTLLYHRQTRLDTTTDHYKIPNTPNNQLQVFDPLAPETMLKDDARKGQQIKSQLLDTVLVQHCFGGRGRTKTNKVKSFGFLTASKIDAATWRHHENREEKSCLHKALY